MSAASTWFSMFSAATSRSDLPQGFAPEDRWGRTRGRPADPTKARPATGLPIDFVVVADRAQLSELVRRVRDGRLRTNIGKVSTIDDAVAAFNPTKRIKGKTIIRVRP